MTWNEFREIFFKHFYPTQYIYQMEQEFIELKQNGQSITKYVNNFTRLSRYAPTMVRDKKAKTRRFVYGLDQAPCQIIGIVGIDDYDKAVDMAYAWESTTKWTNSPCQEVLPQSKKQKTKDKRVN